MKGNAITPENYKKVLEARDMLGMLKEKKLQDRAERYQDQEATLRELVYHLESECQEVFLEFMNGLVSGEMDHTKLALEIADVANCCDLVIFEILDQVGEINIEAVNY